MGLLKKIPGFSIVENVVAMILISMTVLLFFGVLARLASVNKHREIEKSLMLMQAYEQHINYKELADKAFVSEEYYLQKEINNYQNDTVLSLVIIRLLDQENKLQDSILFLSYED